MTQLTADFETGSNGATIATSDPGSATPWDTVNASDAKYDNAHVAHGTLAAKLTYNGTGRMNWSTAFGTQTDHYGRAYIYMTAYPSNAGNEVINVRFLDGASDAAFIFVLSDGRLALNDAVFGQVASTGSLSLNQWVRVEWHVIHNTSTGFIEGKFFNSTESTTPTDTITFSNRNTGAQATQVQIGLAPGTCFSGYSYWIDDIVANATSYPGPVIVPSTAPQVLSMQGHVFGHGVW